MKKAPKVHVFLINVILIAAILLSSCTEPQTIDDFTKEDYTGHEYGHPLIMLAIAFYIDRWEKIVVGYRDLKEAIRNRSMDDPMDPEDYTDDEPPIVIVVTATPAVDPAIEDQSTALDQVIDINVLSGMKWQCREVNGKSTRLAENAELSKDTTKLTDGEVNITLEFLEYNPSSGVALFKLTYEDYFAYEFASIDASTQKISFWYPASQGQKGETTFDTYRLEDGIFFGNLETVETRYWGDTNTTRELKDTHAFFGLISPQDYQIGYFCDNYSAYPIPEAMKTTSDWITGKDIVNFCAGYYYECTAVYP